MHTIKSLGLNLALAGLLFTPLVNAETTDLLAEHKKVIGELASSLQAQLLDAMASDGPVAAISVCQEVAPKIAAELAQDSGISVKRTSLKIRNLDNAPDEWELSVLEQFEQRKAEGEDIATMQYSAEVVNDEGQKVLRYMKAMPFAKACLTCHGSEIATPIVQQLDELYPQDNARDFEVGDIRGAFSTQQVLAD
jgi:hypothetical protein